MRDTREHWSLTVRGAGSNVCVSGPSYSVSDGLHWQFLFHCFVIIDGLYFLSLIVHILADYDTSNCAHLYEFNPWLRQTGSYLLLGLSPFLIVGVTVIKVPAGIPFAYIRESSSRSLPGFMFLNARK